MITLQLKPRHQQLLHRRPTFWWSDAWRDELFHACDLKWSYCQKNFQSLLIIWKKIIAVIDANGFLFPIAKVASITAMIFFYIILHPAVLIYDFHHYTHTFIRKQFHSVDGTEISHMKKWREPKSLSARLIPVFKHCEHLCVGIYSEEREKHGAAWNNPPYTKPAFSKILL